MKHNAVIPKPFPDFASYLMESEAGMRNAIIEAFPLEFDKPQFKTWNAERNSHHNAEYGPGELLDYVFFKANRPGVQVEVAEYKSPEFFWTYPKYVYLIQQFYGKCTVPI